MRVAALTLLAVLALAAPAAAVTETASLGTIRAELSYTPPEEDGLAVTDLALRVFDGETQIAARSFDDEDFLRPAYVYVEDPSVFVSDLDGDGVGEARFDLYTGGAHCCLVTYIYDGATEIKHDFLDPGYRLRDVDGNGVPEFVSADARFNYRFAAYAFSWAPAQVWRLQDGALADVTREPAVAPAVRRDLRRVRRLHRRAIADTRKDPVYAEAVRATAAAHAADTCSLGRCEYRLARRATARGLAGRGFVARVKRVLGRFGYDS